MKYWKQTLQQQSGDDKSSHANNLSLNDSTVKKDGQSVHRAVQAWNERSKYMTDSNSVGDELNMAKIRTPSTILDRVEAILYVDAKHGQGIHAIHRQVLQAGQYVNARRISRGLNPRPLRVGILGYPNVGKSALINRILGQSRAKSADTPGVTRQLRWVKVRADDGGGNTIAYGASATDASGRSISVTGNTQSRRRGEFELLDSPGIIPAHMVDQNDAFLLAACNSIGQAAYENQDVAAFFMERVKNLYLNKKQSLTAPSWRRKCMDRYGFDPLVPINDRRLSVSYDQLETSSSDEDENIRLPTGEDMIYMVAERKCQGDPETAARMILQDFRSGRLGPIVLQLPDVDQDTIRGKGDSSSIQGRTTHIHDKGVDVSQLAKETAELRGIKLPPKKSSSSKEGTDELIGRGLFDGW
jgi:ribosome biogenesis GTPase A